METNYLVFLSLLTGAKPVFPGKDDKDKPKFALKGSKDKSKYPFTSLPCSLGMCVLGGGRGEG